VLLLVAVVVLVFVVLVDEVVLVAWARVVAG
jgi:hypothetical protein